MKKRDKLFLTMLIVGFLTWIGGVVLLVVFSQNETSDDMAYIAISLLLVGAVFVAVPVIVFLRKLLSTYTTKEDKKE